MPEYANGPQPLTARFYVAQRVFYLRWKTDGALEWIPGTIHALRMGRIWVEALVSYGAKTRRWITAPAMITDEEVPKLTAPQGNTARQEVMIGTKG